MSRVRYAVGDEFVTNLGAAFGEGVGDVLQEDQAEDEVLELIPT